MDKLYIVQTLTDWWIITATIGAGALSALATWFAVVFTNKKTAERYIKDKQLQDKANAMVIIKPSTRLGTFATIIEELVVYNIRDRVLLLSSEKTDLIFMMISVS